MRVLEGLSPERVLYFFEELTRIPRESGNEKGVSDYLAAFAKENGLEVIQDDALNVIIRKPASKGYEDRDAVILQGHMDMVCTKTEERVIDFAKDPIDIYVDGDFIRTKGTTLGGDNGIAVAMTLALLEDKDAVHPELEALFTTEEETGMGGAMKLDGSLFKGKTLINIDSEEEGIFLTSCAGGVRTFSHVPVEWTDNRFESTYALKITGLTGGHSGIEIQKGRANALRLLGRFLEGIEEDFSVSEVSGGEKMNAIARMAYATITTDMDLDAYAKKMHGIFLNEYAMTDPELKIEVTPCERPNTVFSKRTRTNVIGSLLLIPNGVQTMSSYIEGLVESSNNMGVLSTSDTEVVVETAVRSSIRSLKYEIVDRIKSVASLTGAKVETKSDYPEWEYNPNSKIRDLFINTYEELTGEKAVLEAIHAGLECGVLMDRIGDLDMVSFGPNMGKVHTPQEYLSISSVGRTYDFLKEILRRL